MTSPHGYCLSPLSPSPSSPLLSHPTSRGPFVFCAQSPSTHFQGAIPHRVYTLALGVCWLDSSAQNSHSRLTAPPHLHFLAPWEFLLLVAQSIPRCVGPVESLLVDLLSLTVRLFPCKHFQQGQGCSFPSSLALSFLSVCSVLSD